MANRRPKRVLYRRQREQKTNYHTRLAHLLSRKPRLVIRFTNTKIISQLISFTYQGDTILAAADSSALRSSGWTHSIKNIPAAYLTGYLLGKKAVAKGWKEAVFDIGFRQSIPKGRVYAFLKGALDAGIAVPYGSTDIFPPEERIRGKHISHTSSLPTLFEKVKESLAMSQSNKQQR